jgi:ribose/xylose/arabinose/galactoside ABC-type transport system permease subunit
MRMDATAVPSRKSGFSLRAFISRNRRAASALVVFLVMMALFMASSPEVWLSSTTAYTAVFVSLPVSIMLAVPLVFVVAAGEIDLAFPSVFGLSAYAFALCVQRGGGPWLGLVLALLTGAMAGWVNGLLVTRAKLSSLVSTLGMNFLLRGLINLSTQGIGIPLTSLRDTPFYQFMTGEIAGVPVQMIWALLAAILGVILFNRHRFGADCCAVGDNQESAREMGISVERTKSWAYIYIGISAALAGVISSLINSTFWPSAGDGYLLSTLAAVFVGGTPTWGGVGTVTGAVIGCFTVGFMQTGIIAAGLTGFWTQFFYGLVIILSLLGHRFNSPRYRS